MSWRNTKIETVEKILKCSWKNTKGEANRERLEFHVVIMPEQVNERGAFAWGCLIQNNLGVVWCENNLQPLTSGRS